MNAINSLSLRALIEERNETPELIAYGQATDLYRFKDGTEVIVTNAGLVTKNDRDWHDFYAAIMRLNCD